MLELDRSWKSLFKPGEATEYFNLPVPLAIQAGTNNFNLSNAWWLAEISRLIYHPDFYNDKNIKLAPFEYEVITYIEVKSTSTHVAVLKVIQATPCLVVVFRGTDEIDDWNINAHAYQSSFNNRGKVHSGFKKAYLSIRKELFKYLKSNTLPVFITGHSLGAALATLATSELFENEQFDSCYTFGSPRTGNPDFVNTIKCQQIYRVVNNYDVVTTVPVDFAQIKYVHVGLTCLIDKMGVLLEGMSQEEVYTYQKNSLEGLKDYAISKLFNDNLKSVKNDLPSFLSDHSPINYVLSLQNLLKKQPGE